MSNTVTVTVSQVNRRVALMLKNDVAMRDIYVKGELSNFTDHAKTGHFYFTLKDEATQLRAVMFSSYAEKVRFLPEDGMSVKVRASVQAYERDGVYQLYVTEMEPDGEGGLYAAFEQLKKKLELGGYFSQKRRMPERPRKICVITAEGAAALQDILNILSRRYPLVSVVLIPALVQGKNAPASIIRALHIAQGTGADLIIFGRGGGSVEDLWAFNDEGVAHAIYNSAIPTISAVGHETDFTIADFVADFRAPTPSAAAELAVPDMRVLRLSLVEFRQAVRERTEQRLDAYARRLDAVKTAVAAKTPEARIKNAERVLELTSKHIRTAAETRLCSCEAALQREVGVISALSPLNVLTRGYSIVYKDNFPVRAASQLNNGDEITLRLAEGTAQAVVKNTGEILKLPSEV